MSESTVWGRLNTWPSCCDRQTSAKGKSQKAHRSFHCLLKGRGRYSSSWEPCLRATGRHLPYGITRCYLPPDTSERAPPNASHAGWYSIYLPRGDGRLSWPSWLDNALAASRTSDLSITSPTPNRCTTETTARWTRHTITVKCQCQCQMSKTFIGGAVCREFESEALAAEEMLGRIVCSREQFSDVPWKWWW